MSAACSFVNRNVAKLKVLEKVETHPQFPAKYKGEAFQKYFYGAGSLFHVYMVISGWVGVWSFFSRCPSLQMYEKLVLVALRFGVMSIHAIGTGFFLLGCVGGSAFPLCERITHLYHQFMVCYRAASFPLSILCLVGSLLNLSLDQFGWLLLSTPLEAFLLVWHVLVCDAFLRWGNVPADSPVPFLNGSPRAFIDESVNRKMPSPLNALKKSAEDKVDTGTASKNATKEGSQADHIDPKAVPAGSSAVSGPKSEKSIDRTTKKD